MQPKNSKSKSNAKVPVVFNAVVIASPKPVEEKKKPTIKKVGAK